MPKVVSNLWFAEEAREAVEFYVSVIPDSRIGRTTILLKRKRRAGLPAVSN